MQIRNPRTALRRSVFALFLVVELFVGWKNYQDIAATEKAAGEPVAEWERRLAPLKKIIPFSKGVVGYVSDSTDPGIDYYNPNGQIEYTLTQYVMAPIVVRKGAGHTWLIGNFSKQAYAAWMQDNPGHFDVKSLRYGFYLIHRLDK